MGGSPFNENGLIYPTVGVAKAGDNGRQVFCTITTGLDLGQHSLTLEVNDGTITSLDELILIIANSSLNGAPIELPECALPCFENWKTSLKKPSSALRGLSIEIATV